jgi:hypothetical protein
MYDDVPQEGGTTATMAPPEPPDSPPATGVATSGPGPRRRGCMPWIAALFALVVLAGGIGAFLLVRSHPSVPAAPIDASAAAAYASAMNRAGVKAPPMPRTQVELSSLQTMGSHKLDATFTYAELAALLQAFGHTPPGAQHVEVRCQSIAPANGGALRLVGSLVANGQSFDGWVQAPVRFTTGSIQITGPVRANIGGLTWNRQQATQAGGVIVNYLNALLVAAPGLQISTADLVDGGVHVTGTAPNTIEW